MVPFRGIKSWPSLVRAMLGRSLRLQCTQVSAPVVNKMARVQDPKTIVCEKEAALVVFDKDGTLISLDDTWVTFWEETVNRLSVEIGLDVRGAMSRFVGYDTTAQRVCQGPLAEQTMLQLRNTVVQGLQSEIGLTPAQAERVVHATWQDHLSNKSSIIAQGNLPQIFCRLKAHGIKVAIFTADTRHNTEMAVVSLGLGGLLDAVMCSDDADSEDKPSPRGLLNLCRRLAVPPHQAAMVGDTRVDLFAARNAGLALAIGVLSGAGDREELKSGDAIVKDVSAAAELVMAAFAGVEPMDSSQLTVAGIQRLACSPVAVRNRKHRMGTPCEERSRNYNSINTQVI
uniref:phosphoglycolate phosphatase, chromosomal-like isoform X2 n=1 Tax=Myxine glutinosa TaxID=7769 RepID=UPI00358EF6E6